MGYYMRFIVTDDRAVEMADLRAAYCAAGAGYCLGMEDATATVSHEGRPIAQVTLNAPGDGLFDQELAEMIADVERAEGEGRDRVLQTLRAARQIVAVEALFGDGEPVEDTLEHVDPLWWWLFHHREGLVQADGEGYYEFERRVLTVR